MNEKDPLFSIVIPAYNEGAIITECIESLEKLEGGFDIEIIVVDNNSTDNTSSVAEGLGMRVLKESLQGVGSARRAGTAIARGEYITHVDADTHLPPDYLKKVLQKFEKEKDLACIGGQMFYYDAPVWKNVLRLPIHWGLWFFSRIVSRGKFGPMGNNMTFKKDLYNKTSGFDKDLRFGEDMNLCNKLSEFGKVRLDMSLKCYVSIRRFVFNKKLWVYFLNFMKMCLFGKPYKNILPPSQNI